MRVFVDSLGCRVNRYDGAAIAADLAAHGWDVVDGPPYDAYVLNSCTVTAAAESDGRRRLARARRTLGPAGLVAIAGCSAQVHPEAHVGVADLVVPTTGKASLAGLLTRARTPAHSPVAPRPALPPPLPVDDRSSRFFLKVQEGCDVRCTYCVIPDARGPARSAPPEDVVSLARRACEQGFREIVVAGIHLGGYGRDLGPGAPSLARLCRRILDETGVARLRLGSLEPWGVRDDLVALFRHEPRMMPSLRSW